MKDDKIEKRITEISISIDDELTMEEISDLLQCLRDIEQNKPDRLFKIFINSPNRSTEEMKQIFSSIEPKFAHTGVIELKKKDD